MALIGQEPTHLLWDWGKDEHARFEAGLDCIPISGCQPASGQFHTLGTIDYRYPNVIACASPICRLFASDHVTDYRALQSERTLHTIFWPWTTWGSWTACSSTCGEGVMFRTRKCLRNSLKNICVGEPRQYKSCQSKLCSMDAVPFRNMQCALYNNRPFPGSSDQRYSWVPFYEAPIACDLNCLAVGHNFYYTFGRALDGTSCRPDSVGTCINGKCLTAGCDGVLGSNMTNDSCGYCGGRNHSCILIKNVFRDPYPSTGFFAYKNVTRIPAGALHIKVKDHSHNILALMSLSKGYMINGNWAMSRPGVYKVAGTEVRYTHSARQEVLEAPGPTNEDLLILVLFQELNPGIEYEYWLPKDRYLNIQQDTQAQAQQPVNVMLDALVRTPKSNSTNAKGEVKSPSDVKIGCQKCVEFKGRSQRKKNYCQSDFVIRGKVLQQKKIGQKTRYNIVVEQVYKSKFSLTRYEYIWVSNKCNCPRLQDSHDYIMMPSRHVNSERAMDRIVLSPKSYIKPWSEHEEQQIELLNKIC
ncbi:ADAMTS-like protein 5 [Gastrophryne carolinensis]